MHTVHNTGASVSTLFQLQFQRSGFCTGPRHVPCARCIMISLLLPCVWLPSQNRRRSSTETRKQMRGKRTTLTNSFECSHKYSHAQYNGKCKTRSSTTIVRRTHGHVRTFTASGAFAPCNLCCSRRRAITPPVTPKATNPASTEPMTKFRKRHPATFAWTSMLLPMLLPQLLSCFSCLRIERRSSCSRTYSCQ